MIQRKQTLYLLLAIIAIFAIMFLPILQGITPVVNHEWQITSFYFEERTSKIIEYWPEFNFFIIECLVLLLSIYTIFAYKNRKLQMKLCVVNMILLVIWYVLLVFIVMIKFDGNSLKIGWEPFLPLVAFILIYLAHQGIAADERLVRAADRIR